MSIEGRIPIVILTPSAVPAFQVFNPNDWEGDSRSVVLSCSTELSVLQHVRERISKICLGGKDLCQPHFENLTKQWQASPWDLTKTVCYAQLPELHVLIEAFFASIKSLLDLTVQLLSTEAVVSARLDGFHRNSEVYGGTVLNALDNNARVGKKQVAALLRELIASQKQLWIDDVIRSRDRLVHPVHGAHQLMFEIRVTSHGGSLVYREVIPPQAGGQAIDHYAAARLENAKEFAQAFLAGLRFV